LLVVAGCGSTFSMSSLLLLIHLLGMPLGLLGVLLGEGAVLGRPAPMLVDRLPQLSSLRRVCICLLTVTCCFGGKPLSQHPPLLRPAPHVGDQSRQYGHRDYDYGDNENR
jgi:hypothetical protein